MVALDHRQMTAVLLQPIEQAVGHDPEDADTPRTLVDIFRRAAEDVLRACATAGRGTWLASELIFDQIDAGRDRPMLENRDVFWLLVRSAYAAARQRTALPNMLADLGELLLEPRAVHVSTGACRWTRHAPIPPNRQVLMLDATAEPTVVEGILGRPVERIDTPPVEQRATIYQVMDRIGSRAGNRKDLASERSWTVRLATEVARKHIGQRLLCVTFKQDEQQLADLLQREHGDATVIHYGALRGLNAFAGYEAGLIIGRPMPNEAQLQLLAVAAFGWDDFEAFAKAKLAWLAGFMDLPHGVPSADTVRRVLSRLDPEAFERCFMKWINAVAELSQGKLVAIDGKSIRRSFERSWDKAGMAHMVSAFVEHNGQALAQLKTEGKGRELAAITTLLDLLSLRGATVSIDAIGCQKSIARQIIDQDGQYLLCVKENQPSLHRAVQVELDDMIRNQFQGVAHDAQQPQVDAGHGRIESRPVWCTDQLDWLKQAGDWPGLRSVAVVEAERDVPGHGRSVERRSYISSISTWSGYIHSGDRAMVGWNTSHAAVDCCSRRSAPGWPGDSWGISAERNPALRPGHAQIHSGRPSTAVGGVGSAAARPFLARGSYRC